MTTNRVRLTEDHLIYEMSENQTEDEFIQAYRIKTGLDVMFIPITNTALYDLVKQKALVANEEHPEIQHEFYGNEYCFNKYTWNQEKEDFDGPLKCKFRVFMIPHHLDLNSGVFDAPQQEIPD